MFRRPDDEDRRVRPPDDVLGDAAHEKPRHAGPAVRPEHDEIGVHLFRVVDDRFRRVRRDANVDARVDRLQGDQMRAQLLQRERSRSR